MASFLVTGGAGFIGSNLARSLLLEGHRVRVIDDLSTGRSKNLDGIRDDIEFVKGSVCDADTLARAFEGIELCLHQAAIPSVPRSVRDPLRSNRANVEGSLNVFLAARDAGVRRVVFASSSSVYGNVTQLPVGEDLPLNPISPYAVTKAADELYARTFADLYDMEIVALRYFNVFGPRQDPQSQYAAVIPIFVRKMLAGERPPVFGDGLQSRDFSYIDNVVRANLLACEQTEPTSGSFNIACGSTTSLLDIVGMLNDVLGTSLDPDLLPPRQGDIRDSYADISKAQSVLGYEPEVSVRDGLERAVAWYREMGDDA
ncbi:MAG: SDR family oxidoreductase [bacterium]|nr:SDR family oxidoreductase [bacterium]